MAYNPQKDGIVVSKPFGAIGFNVDARSTYYDDITKTRRPFVSTAEVLSYFDTAFKREGNFTILVDDGSGVVKYWFKDGVTDSDLVLESVGGGGVSTPDATNEVKGKLKLTNHLGGTADLPTVVSVDDVTVGDSSTKPANTKFVANSIVNKVDKVNGKSLILDTEITRLSTVTNQDISGKQDTLVSGTNIKTINGVSVLGGGDLIVSGGGGGGAVLSVAGKTGVVTLVGSDIIEDTTHRFTTDTEKTAWNAKASLASPTFTGTPTLPTGTVAVKQTIGDNSTKLATTSFVNDGLALKANLNSPVLTGNPIAPTQTDGDNTTKLATTEFVKTAVDAAVIGGNYPIHAWGDSMTDGTGSTSNGNYPYQLADILGKTVIKHGYAGYTSTQIKDEFVAYYTANPLEKQNPAIIWAGRNNYASPTTVKSDVATMVALLGHDRYLILGITNSNPGEQIGNSGYTQILGYNSDMQTLYKANFIDIRRELVLNYNSTIPQDVIDFGLDLPPTSLLSDAIHLNDAGYLIVAKRVSKSSDVLYGQGSKFSGSLKILQDDKSPKGRGIELNTVGDTGYISNFDRLNSVVEKLSIQYNAGSELRLIENGGVLKIGTLTSYVTGTSFIPVIDTTTREVKQTGLGSIIPNITTNSISVTNGSNKVIGSDVILDLEDNIIINRGIIVNGGSYHIAPSLTRGVLQLSGSTDRFLIFGAGDAYIYSAAAITQLLSTPDLKFVVGGSEAMKIDTSQQVTVENAPSVAKGVVRKQELDLKAPIRYTAITAVATNIILALTDENTYVRISGTRNITVPPNSTVAFPIGARIDFLATASAIGTFVQGSGVTIVSKTDLILTGFGACTLIKTGTDTWDLIGNN